MSTKIAETVFLSHNSIDKPQVEQIAHRLRDAGVEVWLDKWNLIPGDPWQEEIEKALGDCGCCLVFVGKEGIGPWQNAEMRAAIDDQISYRHMRVIPVLLPQAERGDPSLLPTFLRRNTWVEFRHSLQEAETFERLLAGICGKKPTISAVLANQENPYRGLQVFDIEHSRLFFGRSAVVEWLLDAIRPSDVLDSRSQLKDNRFLAIIGASGSGKSSVARAGLLAALGNGALPDSQHWPQIILKPGEKPLQSLAVALSGQAELPAQCRAELPVLIDRFREYPSKLHDLALIWLGNNERQRLVILADQFEETFTLCKNPEDQRAFIDNLLHAAHEPTGRVIVILTLRADFYQKLTAYEALASAVGKHQYLLSPLAEEELREAILAPAQLAGCDVEPLLVEDLVKDTLEQAGSLPLLQYALMQLWEQAKQRHDPMLRLEDYRGLGGLAGALERRANKVYEHFSAQEQEQCRLVFQRLVRPGEGTADTRRRAELSEFQEKQDQLDVLESMTNERLLTTQRRDGLDFVEVAHEALIGGWSRLRNWIDGERELILLQGLVIREAKEWESKGKISGRMLTEARLLDAESWLQNYPDRSTELERAFVEAEISARDLKLEEEKRQQQKILELEKITSEERQRALEAEQATSEERQKALEAEKRKSESQKRLTRILAVVAAVMVGVAVFALYFYDQSQEQEQITQVERQKALQEKEKAKKQEKIAQQQRLEAEKQKQVAQEAAKEAESQKKLVEEEKKIAEHRLGLVLKEKSEVALKNKEINAASLYAKEALRYFEENSPEANDLTIKLIKNPISKLVFSVKNPKYHDWMPVFDYSSAEEQFAVYDNDNQSLNLWNAVTGELFAKTKLTDNVRDMSYSSDGELLVTASSLEIKLWDAKSGGLIRTLTDNSDFFLPAIDTIQFSPDKKIIASTSRDKVIKLWSTDSGELIHVLDGHLDKVNHLQFSSDSKLLASLSDGMEIRSKEDLFDDTIKLWDTKSGKLLHVLRGGKKFDDMKFNVNSKILASLTSEGQFIQLWNSDSGKLLNTLEEKGVVSFDFSPNAEQMATASSRGGIKIWDLFSGKLLHKLIGGDGYHQVIYSPDGKYLAAINTNRIELWDVISGEVVTSFQADTSTIIKIFYSSNGKKLISLAVKNIKVWDISFNPSPSAVNLKADSFAWPFDYSYDGKQLAMRVDGGIKTWDSASGKLLNTLAFPEKVGVIEKLVYTNDARKLISISKNGIIEMWDVYSGKIIDKWATGLGVFIKQVSYNPNGRQLAISSRGYINLWDISLGEITKKIEGDNTTYSPDGNQLAIASKDSIKLFDVFSGKVTKTLNVKVNGIGALNGCLKYSSNGKKLVFSSDDKVIKAWDLHSGDLVDDFGGVTGIPIGYSPDGAQLAVLYNYVVTFVDVSSGGIIEAPPGIYGIGYNPNGRQFAFYMKNKIELWDLAKLPQLTNRNLIIENQNHLNLQLDNNYNPEAIPPNSSSLMSGKTPVNWSENHNEHWLRKLETTPNNPEYLYQIALIHDRDNNEYRPKSQCLDDNIEALKWYNKALQAGSKKARERIDFLKNWMQNQKDFAGFDYPEDCNGKIISLGQKERSRMNAEAIH